MINPRSTQTRKDRRNLPPLLKQTSAKLVAQIVPPEKKGTRRNKAIFRRHRSTWTRPALPKINAMNGKNNELFTKRKRQKRNKRARYRSNRYHRYNTRRNDRVRVLDRIKRNLKREPRVRSSPKHSKTNTSTNRKTWYHKRKVRNTTYLQFPLVKNHRKTTRNAKVKNRNAWKNGRRTRQQKS